MTEQSFFVDTHCHLDLFPSIQQKVGEQDLLPIKTITVTNSPSFFEPNCKLFGSLKNIRVALGLHPELVLKFHDQINLFEKHIDQTKYIGEIGIDGSKDFISSYDLQIASLKRILSIIKNAQETKILTIHSRNAAGILVTLLKEYLGSTNNKFILHWFTGTQEELKAAINIGCYFSINHKMTSTEKGRLMIANIPINRILTETDAPFTLDAKNPTRIISLTNTLKAISQIHNIEFEGMKKLVLSNFKSVLIH